MNTNPKFTHLELNFNNSVIDVRTTDMSYMFIIFGSVAENLTTLTLPNFPAGFGASATNMSYMFAGFGSNTQISSLTLPDFPVGFGAKADNMDSMFSRFGYNSSNLVNLTLPTFTDGFGANATNMNSMFSNFGYRTSISTLTLQEFPTGFGASATNMNSMFSSFGYNSPNLSSLTLPKFPTGFGASATNISYMFTYFGYEINTDYEGTTIDWTKTLSFTDGVNTEGMFNYFNTGTDGSQILTACNSDSSNVYTILLGVDRPDGLDIIPSGCYVVHYDTNGGTEPAPSDQAVPVERAYTASNYNGTKEYSDKDVYWNTKTDGLLQNDILQGSDKNIGTTDGQTITLYAQWTKENKTMQTFTNDDCKELKTYTDIRLKDIRDNTIYQIRKLPDNKCWMVNNLKLGSTNSEITLTPGDTNITNANWTLPQLIATGESTDEQPQAIGPIPDYSTTDHNSKNFGGYLYNFLAATAGWGTTSQTSEDSQISICPKGWRLPTGGESGEFSQLDKSWGGTGGVQDNIGNRNTWTDAKAFNGVFSGYYYDEFAGQEFTSGNWSSTASNAGAFSSFISTDSASPDYWSYNKKFNYTIRCVANNPSS
jgi:uncharacterized protein (TIGR02145 family)